MIQSHNDFWTKEPITLAHEFKTAIYEVDIIYLRGELMASHSWRPFKWMCYGTLEDYIKKFIKIEEPAYLYIEYKTTNKKVNNLVCQLLTKYILPSNKHVIFYGNDKLKRDTLPLEFIQKYSKLFPDNELHWMRDFEKQYLVKSMNFYTKKWWMF